MLPEMSFCVVERQNRPSLYKFSAFSPHTQRLSSNVFRVKPSRLRIPSHLGLLSAIGEYKAEYFSKQTPQPNAVVDAELIPLGKEIFENGLPSKEAPPCMTCHGPLAEGTAAFPRLANQHQDYIVKQLEVFQRTDERPNTPMTQVAHLLSVEDIHAVAAYLQAFPQKQ